MSILEKLSMSGYAAFVWSAYGITILTLIALYFASKKRLKKAVQSQQQLQQMGSGDESQ